MLSICTTHADDLDVVDTDKYEYLFTYSFPCQSLSVSGRQEGMAKGSGTRSGMLWEFERLLKELNQLGGKDKLPQILLMENVPPILSDKFFGDFQSWISFLYSLGYSSYYKILNAKDFGIPQNRERCFMISILGDYSYQFPSRYGLDIRLKNILEKNVDESYYLTRVDMDRIAGWKAQQKPLENIQKGDSISPTLTARGAGEDHSGMILIDDPVICASRGRNPENPSDRTSGSPTEQRFEIGSDVSNTLTTVQKDNYVLEPQESLKDKLVNHLIDNNICKEGDIFDPTFSTSQLNKYHTQNGKDKGVAPTLLTTCENLGIVVDDQQTICLNSKVDGKQPSLSDRVYDTNGISTTIATSPFFTGSILEEQDDRNLKEKLCDRLVESGIVKEYDTINHSYTNGLCGKNEKSRQTLEDYIETTDNTMNTLTTRPDVMGVVVKDEQPKLRIRKLTERECSRLMGVVEEDFSNMATHQTKSSLYHLSGDSIVTTCLMAILGKLFGIDYKEKIHNVVEKVTQK